MKEIQGKKVFYIKGLSDHKTSTVASMDPYYRNIRVSMPGNNNLDNFGSLPNARNINVCLNGQPFKMDVPDIVVNCMADPDSLEDRLKYLGSILPKFKQRNPNVKIINAPEGILKTSRNDISDLFQGLKDVIVPKVVKVFPTSRRDFIEKIKASGLKLPVIVRAAGTHNGIGLTRLDDFSDEQIEQLDKFALNGGGHYITEFFNFQSPDGYYRKVRIIMLGGKPCIKHMLVSDHWNVHGTSRVTVMGKHPRFTEEEEKVLKKGNNNFSKDALESMQKIYKTLDLDVFGLDVSILPKGKLVVFEINAAMEFLTTNIPQPKQVMQQIEKIRSGFFECVSSN